MSEAEPVDSRGRDIVTECDLDAPPETVWRALTVPELLDAWLLPRKGGEDGLVFDGSGAGLAERIACDILDAEPPRHLRLSWREAEDRETTVLFTLTATQGGGTRLRILHSIPRAETRDHSPRAANDNAIRRRTLRAA